jgi:acyl-CoA synthetase (AMP-forming)/AMP-acid ligase II
MTAAELREYIRGRLPAYMIPSIVCCHERLPLTANGKVDRQALLRQTQRHFPHSAPEGQPADEG